MFDLILEVAATAAGQQKPKEAKQLLAVKNTTFRSALPVPFKPFVGSVGSVPFNVTSYKTPSVVNEVVLQLCYECS